MENVYMILYQIYSGNYLPTSIQLAQVLWETSHSGTMRPEWLNRHVQ